MKTKTIIRLNFLILGLALTIYLAYQVKEHGLNPGVKLLLGLQTDSKGRVGSKQTLKWCDTRVSGLIFPNEFKIIQKGRDWVVEGDRAQALNFIEMEKWLAKYCRITAQPALAEPTDEFTPSMIVKFVNGQIEMLKTNRRGDLLWRGQAYTSPDFLEAIQKLREMSVSK